MLELYSNIKRLRKLHNMSQQELAEAVGYKGKSMIAQVENGKVDLSASMISKFAQVFDVSELELMGLSDNAADPNTSAEAMELYQKVMRLPEDKQIALQKYIQFLQSDV